MIRIIRTCAILGIGLCLVILSVSTRFSNPGLTETQLFLIDWEKYVIGVILMVLIAIVFTVAEILLNRLNKKR